MNIKLIHRINWVFTVAGALLALDCIVGLADWLQGGVMWPLLAVAGGLQAVGLAVRETR